MARLDGNTTVAVELLYFEGCPHWRQAAAAIADAARVTGIRSDVRATRVSDPEDAVRHHFLGSPTVRVAGRDVDPAAQQRSAYALACRVYDSEAGRAWSPPVGWIAAALHEAAGA
ncbi:MAG: DF family (seleno)protein [Gaiellaceae bacterium]